MLPDHAPWPPSRCCWGRPACLAPHALLVRSPGGRDHLRALKHLDQSLSDQQGLPVVWCCALNFSANSVTPTKCTLERSMVIVKVGNSPSGGEQPAEVSQKNVPFECWTI